MLTKTAKLLNYISSYIPLYLALIWSEFDKSEYQGEFSLLLVLLLVALIAIGVVWLWKVLKWKNNTRIGGRIEEQNISKESINYLVTYIIPFISIIDIGFIFGVIAFFLLGKFAISSGNYFSNPMLYFFRFKLYKFGDKRVFSRKSREEIMLYLAENPNGISAREFVANTYIVLQQ